MTHLEWSLSDSYGQRYAGVPQGLASFVNVTVSGLAPTVLAAQQTTRDQIEKCWTGIEETLENYASEFRKWGFECPLVRQFARTRRKGLPKINPLVDISLLCEMRFGVLMGIHDLGQIRGPLVYDCAHAGEEFEGMRTIVRCRENEIVLRDQQGVIASYLQGADKRTCVTSTTEHVVVFAFGAPNVSKNRIEEALTVASGILSPLCTSSVADIRTVA